MNEVDEELFVRAFNLLRAHMEREGVEKFGLERRAPWHRAPPAGTWTLDMVEAAARRALTLAGAGHLEAEFFEAFTLGGASLRDWLARYACACR